MMVNSFYGGVGVGFLNFYIFIIIAVFISGLMVGRTPEFLGKKIEAKEMKIASHYCFAASIADTCGNGIVVVFVCTQSTDICRLAEQSRQSWIQ